MVVVTSPGCCEARREDIQKLSLPVTVLRSVLKKRWPFILLLLLLVLFIITVVFVLHFKRLQNTLPSPSLHPLITNIKLNFFCKIKEGKEKKNMLSHMLTNKSFSAPWAFVFPLTQTQEGWGGTLCHIIHIKVHNIQNESILTMPFSSFLSLCFFCVAFIAK